MPHHHFHPFAHKHQLFRELAAYLLAINITIHTLKRLKRIKPFNDSFSEIPGMPYLIAVFKVLRNGIIQVTMGGKRYGPSSALPLMGRR